MASQSLPHSERTFSRLTPRLLSGWSFDRRLGLMFTRDHWLGETDLRPLGLFRILVGLVTLWDIFRRSEDLAAWHSDDGVLPRSALIQVIARPWRFSLLDAMGSTELVAAFFVFGAVATACLTVGYRTRVANFCTWLFVVSMHERNLLIIDGCDSLFRVLLFWMMFAPAGAAYSLDRAFSDDPQKSWPPRGSAVALRFMQIQVLVLYFVTASMKTGQHWADGSAVFRALQLWDLVRPVSSFVVDNLAVLTVPMTVLTPPFELVLAGLLWVPHVKLRAVLMIGGTLFHLGIELLMNVGMFSLMMPMTYVLFLWPEACDALDRRMPHFRGVVANLKDTWFLPPASFRLAPSAGGPANRLVLAVLGVLMLTVVLNQGHALDARVPPPPRPLLAVMQSLALWQNWNMFAPNPSFSSGPWTGEGTLSNGEKVDALAHGAPDFAHPRPDRLFYSRWGKYRLSLPTASSVYLHWFGQYLCRRYNAGLPGRRPILASFELVYHRRMHRGLDEPERPPVRKTIWRHSCVTGQGEAPR